ncbi:LTA synthase family protein [Evansella cellulosilytica]|uniref:Sulfatase n=1 Tax=Evansella cellulosilytica (strain ATCC 21833 / DSM 2522 / FERM P-1141 / JCM 9156 / N-4) TaxID=649639 RepID=E6TUB8_EVAC2|nr:sulfatase [Evansella cellulosilytica DSM 2522]
MKATLINTFKMIPKPYLLAIFLLWLKTIVVGFISFNITIENILQGIIYLLSPIAFIMFVVGFILLAKQSRRPVYLMLFMIVATFILYANGVYYREFTDYMTLPVLLVGGNASDLTTSIVALIQWHDILFIIDVIVIGAYLIVNKLKEKQENIEFSFRNMRAYFIFVAVVFILNIGIANIERPQLLTRSFDRELLVKNIGIYNYHIYDVYLHTTTRVQRVFASEDELVEIMGYMEEQEDQRSKDLFGAARGKNVILITAESVQNFVINNTVNGEEVTPFLNELIKDSFYFEEFYHQTAQGKTSDSEFLISNSLYPLPRGAVFFTHASNEYYALPEIMKENGYYTASLHANNGSFWNRNVMYDQLGYDRFYDINDYEITNEVGWGLKDIDFMEQSLEHLVNMEQPFYTNLITLTNHFPFDLDEEDHFIDPFNSNSRTLNQYFPTVRYTDEAIKVFFEGLKDAGLYEDSIVVIFGDHYGISSFHNRAMEQYLEKDVTPFVEVQLQQVPLIIHIPGMEGETLSTVSGQIDLRPTLLHLLGITVENQTIFGKNLFSEELEELVILRDGSFITPEVIYTNNVCYDKRNGLPMEEIQLCEHYFEEVDRQLSYSDRIIYGDLLRFEQSVTADDEEIVEDGPAPK